VSKLGIHPLRGVPGGEPSSQKGLSSDRAICGEESSIGGASLTRDAEVFSDSAVNYYFNGPPKISDRGGTNASFNSAQFTFSITVPVLAVGKPSAIT
jgi:hypothetical protein